MTGRTPEEAAEYVRKAQDMMLAYDLAMEDVAGLTADAPKVTETDATDLAAKGKPEQWKSDLWR